ncbi:sulfotransferase [Actinomadura chokoriensis]|uniref:Sulfotransferase n=1 Tax=Actinomadura chokoriensis TaxID=454156 RepID=A0ABV4R4Z8_9ACTN
MTGRARGPIIVLGRPHSGTRLLAGLLRSGGVFLGADLTRPQLDSWSMHGQFTVPLLHARLAVHSGAPQDADLDHLARGCWDAAWPRYAGTASRTATRQDAWGWKCCETAFVMPTVRRLLPGAVFVHLIRDGRDVALSGRGYFQITSPTADPPGWPQAARPRDGAGGPAPLGYREFSRLVTFGEPEVRRWRGIDLDDVRDVVRHRYLLQMKAWTTAVTWARRDASALGGGYHEVRYEELCTSPIDVARALFRRLGLPWTATAGAFLDRHAVSTRAGRWRHARLSGRETRDFADAVAFGRPLLRECGYAD